MRMNEQEVKGRRPSQVAIAFIIAIWTIAPVPFGVVAAPFVMLSLFPMKGPSLIPDEWSDTVLRLVVLGPPLLGLLVGLVDVRLYCRSWREEARRRGERPDFHALLKRDRR